MWQTTVYYLSNRISTIAAGVFSCYNKNMKLFLLLGCLVCAGGVSLHAQQSHAQIARANMPAVVAVNVLRPAGGTFTGTGFVVSPDGYLVTNSHVLDNALYLNITFSNGMVSGEAVPVLQDKKLDLAVLKIQAQNLPHVTLGDSDTVQPGQVITVIGNPRRLQNTVSAGLVSQIRLQKDGTLWHQISAPISPSSSGSPVFNERGEVVSVVFSSLMGEGNQNLNFSIPVNYVKELLKQAGASVPVASADKSAHPLVSHVQKSWDICKRLWHRWFGADSSTLANPLSNS